MEEDLIACTEIVETRLAIGRLLETQSRTFSMASLEPLALATLPWKRLFFHATEAVLLGAI